MRLGQARPCSGRTRTKTSEGRARLARKRGGHLNATATSRVWLDRFLIKVPVAHRRALGSPRTKLLFFCFDLHKQCSGVATRLFGNTPLTAPRVQMSSHPPLPPPGCAPHPEHFRWHGCAPQFRNFWTNLHSVICS